MGGASMRKETKPHRIEEERGDVERRHRHLRLVETV